MVTWTWRRLAALLGSLVFAAGGFCMGSMNAGWFGLERDANSLFPLLGLGAGLVVVGLVPTDLAQALRHQGLLGRATRYLLLTAPTVYILSGLVEFAIFGTLALGFGLICLAVIVIRRRWLRPVDRVLVALSALASLTWNTETVSSFLLLAVGLIWTVLTIRAPGATTGEAGRAAMPRPAT